MLVSMKRNGVARVPTRAKLAPTVAAWRPKKQPMPASEPRCETIDKQQAAQVALLATADNLPPMLVNCFERTTAADGSQDWTWFPLVPEPKPRKESRP